MHATDQLFSLLLKDPQHDLQVLSFSGEEAISKPYQLRLSAKYKPREYCVQYGERGQHFTQRTREEEDLHYHVEHDRDMHTPVFADHQTMLHKPGFAPRDLKPDGLQASDPVIQHTSMSLEARATRSDYDLSKDSRRLEHQAAPLTALQNLTLNAQRQALRTAANKAAPICAVCHKPKERNA